jgi:Subtilase family
MTLLAATAIVTALVGLPAGTTTLPPGAVPPGAHVQVLDRQLGIVAVGLPRRGTAKALAHLRAAPGVRNANIPQAAGGLAGGCTYTTPSGTATSSKASTQWQKTIALSGHNAAGFTVGIPDTGADLGRLGGTRDRLIFRNFTQGTGVGDEIDHGTEIASLIGADRLDLPIRGVAPDVGLAIARIATKDNCNPSLIATNLIAAFTWFRQIGDVNIVNVSATLRPTPQLVQSLRALQQTGTLVVAATGNDPTPGTTTFPAGEPHVVGVGALAAGSTRRVWANSGRGSIVDLVAPAFGSGVVISGAVDPDQQTSVTPDPAKGGTSFAAPLVTGAAALVWARHPSWDASRVAAALMLSAKHLQGARPNTTSGYGRLDVKAALHTTPPADLDEPNDWSAAARGLPLLPHGRPLAASVGGSNDPIDAYPIATTGKLTVRVSAARPVQAYLLRAGSIGAIDGTRSRAIASAATAGLSGRSPVLKVPGAGNWFVVVTAKGATAPVRYTFRVG